MHEHYFDDMQIYVLDYHPSFIQISYLMQVVLLPQYAMKIVNSDREKDN